MAFAGLSQDQLKEVFGQFDADNSGFVERQELLNILNKLAGQLQIDECECKASTKVREREREKVSERERERVRE